MTTERPIETPITETAEEEAARFDAIDADFTPEVDNALQTLRDAGFAVAAFSPTELRGVKAHRVEDGMVEAGWEVIDILAGEEEA